MPRTYFYTFLRDDKETEVEIEYTISAYDPGVTWGPPENCYPAEGGEIDPIKAFDDAGDVILSDGEWERACNEIAELPPETWDDGGDYDY